MGAKTHRDLIAWQLADEIRRLFIDFTARPELRHDHEFREQTNRAARSACRNLAEGFRRRSHQDFARFVDIARGSLAELFDSVDEARHKQYMTEHEAAEWNARIERAIRVANGLHRSLITRPETPGDSQRRAQGKRR